MANFLPNLLAHEDSPPRSRGFSRATPRLHHAHISSGSAPAQANEQMPPSEEMMPCIVQANLRGELSSLNRSVGLCVAQSEPRLRLLESENTVKFLQPHGIVGDFRNCVEASISNASSLCGDSPQKLDAGPNKHCLRGVASKWSSPDLKAHCAGWCELLVQGPVQLDPLLVADHQVDRKSVV